MWTLTAREPGRIERGSVRWWGDEAHGTHLAANKGEVRYGARQAVSIQVQSVLLEVQSGAHVSL